MKFSHLNLFIQDRIATLKLNRPKALNALNKEKPWELHPTNSLTKSVHEDRGMQYPPENPNMAIKNNRKIIIKLLTRLLFPISFILLLI